MQAIETIYNGYRFRSRLEARWAVFFDTLGIKYEYEKEGYALRDGTYYLPDFWLPDYHYWIEIKGQQPTSQEMVIRDGLNEGFGHPVIIFVGGPGENYGLAIYGCLHVDNGGQSESDKVQWFWCDIENKPDINLRHGYECMLWAINNDEVIGLCNCIDRDAFNRHQVDSTILVNAYKAARQAQFEHGKHGN